MTHDDTRWTSLLGGHRIPYDPRAALAKLESAEPEAAWSELWDELHHQGDVDTASFAAVPELVRIHERRSAPDWNTYALVGTIELQRDQGENPGVPAWLEESYRKAVTRLGELAHEDLKQAQDPLIARSALGIIALTKGLRSHARILLALDESEVEEIVEDVWGGAD
jgi:hypothetical protein